MVSSGSSVSPEVACKFQGDNVLLPRCQTRYGFPLLCIHIAIHWGCPLTGLAPGIHVHRWLHPPVTPLLCLLPFAGLFCCPCNTKNPKTPAASLPLQVHRVLWLLPLLEAAYHPLWTPSIALSALKCTFLARLS